MRTRTDKEPNFQYLPHIDQAQTFGILSKLKHGYVHVYGGNKGFLIFLLLYFEPRSEEPGLRGFRPGPTQTDLYKLRKEIDA